MKLFVYHTPEEIPNNRLPGCAVVIDVLRASSTITAAINAGAEAVQVFSEIEPLLEASEAIEEDKRIRAGERGGRKVKSCEFGNSPLAFTPENTEGRRLFLSTTNGTRCSESVRNTSKVVIASLTNREAVVDYLCIKRPRTVWLVGSGWEGSYSLEDTVCAGAIIDGVLAGVNTPLSKLAGNDETIAAVSLFRQWQDQLPELLVSASHGQRLLKMRAQADLEYCAQLDIVDTIPVQRGLGTFAQWQPGVVEKTCEFLGRLVGRKPASGKKDGAEKTAPIEQKQKDPQDQGQAVLNGKGELKDHDKSNAEAKPKAKTEVKPVPKPMEPQAKVEPKTTTPKPPASKSPASKPPASKPPAPKTDGGMTPPAVKQTEPKKNDEQPAVSMPGNKSGEEGKEKGSSAGTAAQDAKKAQEEGAATTPVAVTAQPVDKVPKSDSTGEQGKAALVDGVKGIWSQLTQVKSEYQRVPGQQNKQDK